LLSALLLKESVGRRSEADGVLTTVRLPLASAAECFPPQLANGGRLMSDSRRLVHSSWVG
jgi:hypothetical protein